VVVILGWFVGVGVILGVIVGVVVTLIVGVVVNVGVIVIDGVNDGVVVIDGVCVGVGDGSIILTVKVFSHPFALFFNITNEELSGVVII
jgi:hypothetical protein